MWLVGVLGMGRDSGRLCHAAILRFWLKNTARLRYIPTLLAAMYPPLMLYDVVVPVPGLFVHMGKIGVYPIHFNWGMVCFCRDSCCTENVR